MLNASPPRRTFPLILGLVALLLCSLALVSCRSVDWFFLKRGLRSKFGNENWISTQQLAGWLAEKKRPQPVLLDVRTPAEWRVSHLPGARQLDPNASAATAAGALAKDAPIVTYCSVGYRSGEMARRLRTAGYVHVQNLEGSIFEWANEHRPLVHDGKRTTQVHPYDAVWGHLLDPTVRAPLLPND
ncbi:MAG TPA: rhodanese-like domain-containing protein [Chthoniobacterales bacterium]|jgi:rhodanese-related sulfurtransferase|nr:rhodanese-like domain-containing protein [Chthoniobacterales bacterium]